MPRLKATWVAAVSVIRGAPLVFRERPGTPLRVLCVVAFDTISVLGRSRRLSAAEIERIAGTLDFGACANALLDRKPVRSCEYRDVSRLLATHRGSVPIRAYLDRLRELESTRPAVGGDTRHHSAVVAYREAVARLSLGVVAAAALDDLSLGTGVNATEPAGRLSVLFRLVMLCQILDDLLDWTEDAERELPSFLTGHSCPKTALALTSAAAQRYAHLGDEPLPAEMFPFRVALRITSVFARGAVGACQLFAGRHVLGPSRRGPLTRDV